ncbi:hypothetical protein DFH94DRAFT_416506 [Russula ochroleuca]|uniref:Uncharacterized protein n=1 Tax=Russula ochroleuca TaxID=152965 RepID=A0A9P5MYY7_9AGAM|nr:hypothetical protein DFH94DRAFT_416506 [Russula ochroleuca]
MSSIQPVHVHFPALLLQPPVDRVRKRGLVYPKLAQSRGSGDRMHSPDLFWGSRRVSAAPSGPEPRKAVPRGSIHLPKPATVSGILRLFIPDRTCFEPRYVSTSSSEHISPLLFGFVGVGGPLDASSRCTPAIEVDGGGSFVPSSPPYPSTPISSYSSGTSTSGRDSENSSVVFDVGS